MVGAAAAGLPIGMLLATAPRRRWLLHALLLVVGILASLALYRTARYLCNPLVPIIALVLAAELTAIVVRHARRATPTTVPA